MEENTRKKKLDETNIMIGGGIVTPQQSEVPEKAQSYETFVFYLK